MQTSYTIISIYKQRLTALDRAIHNPTRQQQNQPHNQPVVEHRRLLQRFRQFLSDEEKFWTNLVLRLKRNFAVDDAQPALVKLGLTSPQDTTTSSTTSNTNGASNGGAVDAASSTAQVTEPINPNRRNQFQFPPESETPNPSTPTLHPKLNAKAG
ncbi:hypothetical protein NLI96_g276 [Meripilus lineatus]|uniref:Telomerase activating protein Est1-like N-terminal domain-containing protein n=1 Tax=Meripilus lineatus TaxID=2056292 RepID=A0AAD5VCW4_9APHY|nr:hypothetical protein NLI96_g276 [Physisporinus lineatus]